MYTRFISSYRFLVVKAKNVFASSIEVLKVKKVEKNKNKNKEQDKKKLVQIELFETGRNKNTIPMQD